MINQKLQNQTTKKQQIDFESLEGRVSIPYDETFKNTAF